ncbi:hypothetical protein CXG81DRAFT_11632, partial [Caulochytrium protostelioides]
LSVVEGVFIHTTAPTAPQVIMGLTFSLRPRRRHVPQPVTVQRIMEIAAIAGSEHYRLGARVRRGQEHTQPFGKTAAELPIHHTVYSHAPALFSSPVIPPHGRPDVDHPVYRAWFDVIATELNTQFDIESGKAPLWKMALIVPPQLGESYRNALAESRLDAPDVEGGSDGDLTYYVMFFFHHCLGDGMSILACAKSFVKHCTQDNLTSRSPLKLNQVPLCVLPPPLLDNILNPSVANLIPTGLAMGWNFVKSKTHSGFKAAKMKIAHDHHASQSASHAKRATATSPSNSTSSQSSGEPRPALEEAIFTVSGDVGPASSPPVIPPAAPSLAAPLGHSRLLDAQYSHTGTRFLWYEPAFVSALRAACRSEKTSVAAMLVAAGMACSRTAFEIHPLYAPPFLDTSMAPPAGEPTAPQVVKKLPNHQGWVVTSSMRHLVPGSQLLRGADKETDVATRLFCGYSGSVAQHGAHVRDNMRFWNVSRRVGSHLGRAAWRASMGRMLALNWVYRRKRIWEWAQRRTDASKWSQAYSVELANLGAWSLPRPGLDLPINQMTSESIDPIAIDRFWGFVSSNYDGVRALFTLATVTLGGRMALAVTYDTHAVPVACAERFATALDGALRHIVEAQLAPPATGRPPKLTVGRLRCVSTGCPPPVSSMAVPTASSPLPLP